MAIVIYAAASSYAEAKEECSYRKFLVAYISGVLASCILTTILTFATSFVSARGSLADGKPRKNIKYLLYTRIPLLLFDFAWAGFGTAYFVYSKIKGKEPCKAKRLMTAIKTTVIGNWVMIGIYIIAIYLLSRPETKKKKIKKHDTRKDYDKCLNKIFKCGGNQKAATAQGALNDVASLLAYYFQGTDLAFTDVLAGLRLLGASQQLEAPPHVQHANPPPGKPAWMTLELAARYIRYAAGMYGWPHFTAAYGPKGLYRVFKKMKCPCQNPASDKSDIRLDNCCYCNTAVLLEMTDAYGPDLRYFTLHNAIYQVPFSVLLDHAVKSIVIVIRGSLTLEDWVTDLSVVGEEYTIPDGCGGKMEVKGHKGFFESGIYLTKVLRAEGIIEKLYEEVPDYSLVVTGQSLGAGVAPPLALYLREWYPDVQCFAYSPPGCVISNINTTCTMHNVCTVVVGDDLVSHMSITSLQAMKQDVLKALSMCNLPKFKVLRCGYRVPVQKSPESMKNDAMVEMAQREQIYPEIPRACPEKSDSSNETATSSGDVERDMMTHHLKSEDLCLPGVIMYVFKPPDTEKWLLSWEKPENFNRIIVSSKVIDHHFPFTVAKVLAEAVEQNSAETSN